MFGVENIGYLETALNDFMAIAVRSIRCKGHPFKLFGKAENPLASTHAFEWMARRAKVQVNRA